MRIVFLRSFYFYILLSLWLNSYCFAYTYEKKFELPPLKLTYEDLNNINSFMINELTNRIHSNQSADISKSIKISSEDITFEKKDDFILSKNDPLPDISRSLYLVYKNNSGQITEIVFNFRDYGREISIQGNSNEVVETIHLLLIDKFNKKTFMMGGIIFRVIVLAVMYIFGNALIIFSIFRVRLLKYQRVVLIGFGLSSMIFAIILLTSTWFPGFVLYKESTSFIGKYSAEISFLGLILTIFLFPLGIYFSYRFSARNISDRNKSEKED